jgi:hypothetical protein
MDYSAFKSAVTAKQLAKSKKQTLEQAMMG